MKTSFLHISRRLATSAGLLMILAMTLCPREAAAQAAAALEQPYSFNAGGSVQIGGAPGWSLFSSIGEPCAADAMNSTSGDITWLGFPTILPIGVPADVREEQVFADNQQSRIVDVTPNPFAGEGQITFTLARTGYVRLTVYDMLGRQRATLVQGIREPGTITAHWRPESLDAGSYLVRLTVDGVGLSAAVVEYYR